MLIHGLVNINDCNGQPGQNKGRFLRSCLLSKKINDNYYVCVKNSMYPNSINYKVTDLKQVHSKFIKDGKLGLLFKRPNHQVLVQADDKGLLQMFLRQIQDIVAGKKVMIGSRQMPKSVPAKKVVTNRFDPMALEFTAVDRFDRRLLNMKHLNKLVLENCILPSMPEQIGHLPIAYLSLTGSKLYASQYDLDTFWDWAPVGIISDTLKTLRMDSIGLKILPFEIMFLKNLQTLSVSKNNLEYLPHFIGELKKLQYLYLADNMLCYLPDIFYKRILKELDVSNNPLVKLSFFDHLILFMNRLNFKKEKKPTAVHKLSHLSLYSLINNSTKFKRQEIPRTLWQYFDVVCRCMYCNRLVLPYYYSLHITSGYVAAENLIRNQIHNNVKWQSVKCNFICIK